MIQLPILEGEILIPGVNTHGLYRPHLLPKLESDWLLGKISGLPCTLRVASLVPGFRCAHQDTVIPAHIGGLGKGMSTKVSDLEVCAACHTCHDLIDMRGGRWGWLMEHHALTVSERMRLACDETRRILLALGHIQIAHGSLTK